MYLLITSILNVASFSVSNYPLQPIYYAKVVLISLIEVCRLIFQSFIFTIAFNLHNLP